MEKKSKTVKCLECGSFFEIPSRSRAGICSNECLTKRKKAWCKKWYVKVKSHGKKSKIIKCLECGSFFEIPSRSRAGICSNECLTKRKKAWRENWRVKVNPRSRHCIQCNKPFESYNNAKLCSIECKIQRTSLHNSRYSKQRKKNSSIKCLYCHKEFKPVDGRQKCCSATCSWLRRLLVQKRVIKRRTATNILKNSDSSIFRPFHGHCDWSIGEEVRILRLIEKFKNIEGKYNGNKNTYENVQEMW